MDKAASGTEQRSLEQEVADLVKYIDLYIRQKTDLYMQHYVFEPFDFILRQVIYLSVLAALLVVGALAVVVGSILFISTLIPLWAALLSIGILALLLAGIIAYVLFSREIVLKTPKTTELIESGKA